jgi:hypothetical protein
MSRPGVKHDTNSPCSPFLEQPAKWNSNKKRKKKKLGEGEDPI